MVAGFKEFIRVFFDHEDEFANHIGLWTVNILRLALGKGGLTGVGVVGGFLVVGVVFGEIGVHPDFDLTRFGDKDHFLDDVKVANLFVEKFEAVESGFVHVKEVLEGNVVDLLESEFDFISIQVTCVNCCTHLMFGLVYEVSDRVDESMRIKVLWLGFNLSVSEFSKIGIEILLSYEI